MTAKDFISQVFSRKSSVAAIGIFALVYIATVSPGQLAIDGQTNISLVPAPAGLPADWKIPVEITLIACLAIIVQGMLDYFRDNNKSNWNKKYLFDLYGLPKIPPEDMPQMPSAKEPAPAK
ncbi:MAG: hypothetical protein MUP16_12820 [Sedimentisphaerales bacterium]|nr:hypothetical protein [Sedimentisphaerales bacterium]